MTSIKTTRKKILVTHTQDKAGNIKYDRQDIADVFAEFYEELYTSTTKAHEHEQKDHYEQYQHTVKSFTMPEPSDSINQLNRGEAADTRGLNAEVIKYSARRLLTHNHHQSGRTRRSKLYTRAGTHDHKQTTDPSCANSSGSSSSRNYNPRLTSTSPVTKQASDWSAPRQTAFSRASNSAAVGRSHRLQRSLRQWNTAGYGRLSGSKASRSHTYSYSQNCTTSNKHQCTRTLTADTSTSSEETSRETRSTRCCSNQSCITS